MGLAGPRKRTKISHDPNNTNWSRSTTSFGHKILTAQGWAPGTLLGAKNAPHAQYHSTASESRIRVVLKDDNLGLGAKRGSGQAEGECTGLSAFQGLLGRLNGKTEDQVDKEKKAREDIQREMSLENRWGLIRFVKGGCLIGDKIGEHTGNRTDRTQRWNETSGISPSCGGLSAGVGGENTQKKHEDADDGDDSRKTAQDRGEEAEGNGEKARRRGNDCIESWGLESRGLGKRAAKRKPGALHAITTAAKAQPSAISDPSLSDKGECGGKSRKLKRRLRKGIKYPNTKEQVAETGGNQLLALRHPFLDVTAAESEKLATPTMPTDMPRGRHVVRQRYIQQKKNALLDAQALNEILMIKA